MFGGILLWRFSFLSFIDTEKSPFQDYSSSRKLSRDPGRMERPGSLQIESMDGSTCPDILSAYSGALWNIPRILKYNKQSNMLLRQKIRDVGYTEVNARGIFGMIKRGRGLRRHGGLVAAISKVFFTVIMLPWKLLSV